MIEGDVFNKLCLFCINQSNSNKLRAQQFEVQNWEINIKLIIRRENILKISFSQLIIFCN